MNGLFCGAIPTELQDLTPTEISLCSPINVIGKVIIQTKYVQSKAKTFSIINDVEEVCKSLPNVAYLNSMAVLRSPNSKTDKQYQYRPAKVRLHTPFPHSHPMCTLMRCFPPHAPSWQITHLGSPRYVLLCTITHPVQPTLDALNVDTSLSHLPRSLNPVKQPSRQVKLALRWLKKNNRLFRYIKIDYPADWNINENEYRDPPGVHVTDADEDVAAAAALAEETDLAGNMTTESSEQHIQEELILPPATIVGPEKIMNRGKGGASYRYNNPQFVYQAFILMYPFGYGYNPQIQEKRYVAYTLKLGGDRRFQRYPNWYFYWYYDIISNRLGGLAARIAERQDEIRSTRQGNMPHTLTQLYHTYSPFHHPQFSRLPLTVLSHPILSICCLSR